jgi:23S rRNA pseudouridine1911/1915/1917 synthase
MPDSDVLTLRISPQARTRLDLLILEELRAKSQIISRAQLKEFFQDKQIQLNGRTVAASEEVSPGTHTVTISGWDEFVAASQSLRPASSCFLPIVYEDENILVLHKSSGVPSVSLSSDETNSATAAALAHFPALAQIEGAKPLEPGLLHRLDTATSGLLAFVKTAAEFSRLREAWKTPSVRKIYRAVVEAEPGAKPPTLMTITHPIARPADSSKRVVVLDRETREKLRGPPQEAITHIRAVKSLLGNRFDLEIEIETGVMHQIRAHLAHQGWPIIGDPVYGKTSPGQRLMLHAWKLTLPLKEGVELVLESMLIG